MPLPALAGIVPQSLVPVAAAVLVPLALAVLVYLDARHRRGRSLAPMAWAATTFFTGVGCVVVAACYVVVSRT